MLKVAMECSYAPYNWTQPTDANGAVPISGSSDYAYGYDVMMLRRLPMSWAMDWRLLSWTGILLFLQFSPERLIVSLPVSPLQQNVCSPLILQILTTMQPLLPW